MMFRSVVKATAAHFEMTVEDILGTDKQRRVTQARCVASYILRERRNLSFPNAGRVMERDHSTILHHVTLMKKRIADDPNWLYVIDTIDKKAREGDFALPPVQGPPAPPPKPAKTPSVAAFNASAQCTEMTWYRRQNEAYVEAVIREHGEGARW